MKTLFTIAFMLLVSHSFTQILTQNIRGTVIDIDSKTTLPGANIIFLNGDDPKVVSTDIDGNFILENIPVGRISLIISFIGYQEKNLSNLVLSSGKEMVLNIELQESLIKLETATVSTKRNKTDLQNDMALISAKGFTVEETSRFAGSFSDPARMVSAFAGVTGDSQGNNDIVVRGNSSKGILWRLEGIEIPNPNHFSDEGSTGGPINTLNSAMLSNSDFYTGAFAPEYGNATSGVFDMKMRKGNTEKHEYAFSAGVLGLDFTAEGPLTKGANNSFLANYRYSSLAILDDLNIVDFGGVPKYQDGSFKLHIPTKNTGVFSFFGLGGISRIKDEQLNEEDQTTVEWRDDYLSNMGVIGLNHKLLLNKKMYLKTQMAVSTNGSGYEYFEKQSDNLELRFKDQLNKNSIIGASTVHLKLNAKNKIQAGVNYTNYSFEFISEYYDSTKATLVKELDVKDNTDLIQSHISWKHRINEDVTFVTGLHSTYLNLRPSFTIEPRFGINWKLDDKQGINFGVGLHSKMESLTSYFALIESDNDKFSTLNKDLKLAKSMHFIAGYDYLFNPDLRLKTEIYYQHLYDIPVAIDDQNKAYSLLNSTGGFTDIALTNSGTGRNYGAEITLEKFFSNNYFFLVTASIYESKYTAADGIERKTRFSGDFAGNIILGKEWDVTRNNKQNVLGISTKVQLIGGMRFTPLDLEASIADNESIMEIDNPYGKKSEDVFQLNFACYYRKNKKNANHEIKLDIQNITNNAAKINEYYNSESQKVENGTQLPILPNIVYKIEF